MIGVKESKAISGARNPAAPGVQVKTTAFTDAEMPPSKVSVNILCFYIFLVVSRVLDVSLWYLHLPLILLAVLTIIMLARGDFRKLFSSKITRAYTALTVWVLVSYGFSDWRGGSMGSALASLQALAIYLIILQMVRTTADWKRVTGAYAYAVVVAGLLSFYLGHTVSGRIALSNGSYADPNEFALVLVVGLPLWWLTNGGRPGFRTILLFLGTALILVAFARTGSRSGLVALATLWLVTLIFANVSQKFVIFLAAVIAVGAGALFLPSYLKVRFTTFFSSDGERFDSQTQEKLVGDLASTSGRKWLLEQGIGITFEHPFLGVGPGLFADSSWNKRKRETGMGGWAQVSHNTYVQYSSETGIPGLIFFSIPLFLSVKYTLAGYLARRRSDSDSAKLALYFFACLAVFSVGIFFLSIGYTYTIAMLFALATTMHDIVLASPLDAEAQSMTDEIPARKSAAPQQQPERLPLSTHSEFRLLGRRNPRKK
jgi:O-antigen ligase